MTADFAQAMAAHRAAYLNLLVGKADALRDAWARVQEHASADSLDRLRRIVHALAGSGGTYGFPDLSHAASLAEQALGRSAGNKPPAALDRIRHRLDELVAVIRRITGDAPKNAGDDAPALTPAAVPADRPPQHGQPASATDPVRVVVVEDDDPMRTLIEEMLAGSGFAVRSAPDGSDLEALLAEFRPDILLLDLLLPAEGGTELTLRTRQADPYRDLPIVVMSTETSLREQIAVVDCGADAFLFKPLIPELLVATLRSRAERYRETQRLQREVRDLVAKLRVSTEEALAAARAKERFVANISHELRTPLNGIIGMSDLLAASELPPDAREAAETIRSSGSILLELINDVLDFAKLESGQLSVANEPVALRDLVDQVVRQHALRAKEKGILLGSVFSMSAPPAIYGDLGKTRQILSNLIANAVKFTPSGGVMIEVTGRPGLHDDGSVEFSVRDTGIGIPPQQISGLFMPFVQADGGKSQQFGGTGLGLAISKRLASALGGDIRIESKVGHGSVFTLTLKSRVARPPDAAVAGLTEPSTATGAGRTPQDALAGRRILVADDNETNRLVATRMLERLGCIVEAVPDGGAATRAAQSTAFDAILLDCQMPVLDGYGAARAIRGSAGPNQGTTIIAITANAQKHDRDLCHAAGMNGYLAKPVKIAALLHELRQPAPGGQRRDQGDDPPFDHKALAGLRELEDGEDDFVDGLIASFACRSAEGLDEMRELAKSGGPERAAKVAHRLKGSALNLGLLAFARTCGTLESLLRRGPAPEAEGLLSRLARQRDEALIHLSGNGQPAGSAPSAATAPEPAEHDSENLQEVS